MATVICLVRLHNLAVCFCCFAFQGNTGICTVLDRERQEIETDVTSLSCHHADNPTENRTQSQRRCHTQLESRHCSNRKKAQPRSPHVDR